MKTALNLGTFLSVLCHYKASTTRQTDLVGAVIHTIYSNFDDSDNSCCSNLVRGKKNPKRDIIDSAIYYIEDNYQDLVKSFQESVLNIIDQNCYGNIKEALITIIESDASITENCIVNPITGTSKKILRKSKDQLSELLAGLFLYVLKSTDNSEKTDLVRSLDERFYKKIDKNVLTCSECKTAKNTKEKTESKKITKDSISVNEDVFRAAQRFCVHFEKELGLLPLCQIASFVSPLHSYVREMYTEYCLCSQAEKEMILSLNNQMVMDFSDKNWITRCLKLYNKKIHDAGICTNEFLYEGAK